MSEERVIKYRVWASGEKKMFPVARISFGDDGSALTLMVETAPRGKYYRGLVQGENGILLQYTGLRDAHGVDIYEADIVVQPSYPWFDGGVPGYRGTVEWIYAQWQVVAHCVNPNKVGISDGINRGLDDEGAEEGSRTNWEVIGNRYEMPELLIKAAQP
jgi:uncharacterized phage protein (TIGR01671 family)